jgi:predicted branched-subunit amino acid permease
MSTDVNAVDDRAITRAAIRDVLPLYLPTIPFALVLGVAMTESVLGTPIAWSTNVTFAGAAQLATVTLAGSATWLTLVLTATIINLRHVMYSAALSPRFRDQPAWFRWAGPFVLVDQLFALTSTRTDLSSSAWRRYYLSAGLFLLVTWIVGVTVGVVAGSAIPTEWRLDVAPAVMFGGLVALGVSTRPAAVAAITGAVVCFAGLGLPNNGGVLLGATTGVLAGFLADKATDDTAGRSADSEAVRPADPIGEGT